MGNGLYYIIVVVVAVWAVFSGYRRGFMSQIGAVIAVAFGIVAARLLSPEFVGHINSWLPDGFTGFNRMFLCETLTCGLIFIIVSGLIGLCVWPIGKLVGLLGSGVVDALGGAFFRLFQMLILLSIVYNLLVDLNPSSDLTRSSSRHDGNLVEGVMQVAPALLGFPGAEEVAYRQQLEEAKKIS